MTDSGTRKLAAVMFTDIAGYTSMVQNDEASALEKVNTHREVLDEFTTARGGQIISFYGDGSLSTYTSAIDAVNCAMEMQAIYQKTGVPVRIGIHLGDIVYKQDSVFGDGVNVASRIQNEGVSGSVLISSRLQQEIANHTHITTKSLGNYDLKNVRGSTEIFAITNNGLAVPRRKVKIPVYAVVILLLMVVAYIAYDQGVFTNSNGSTSQELRSQRVAVRFQDYSQMDELSGMAAHWITNRLSEIPDAQVVNYSVDLNIPNTPIAAAGLEQRQEFEQRTKAVNVIEGAIYKQGDQLMLDAALINLETGATIQPFEIVRCDLEDPMNGISKLTGEILGWWASRNDNVQSIPNYDGYLKYMDARATWQVDPESTEVSLIESISADSTFIDPYFLLTQLYEEEGDLVRRDSMIQVIRNGFREFTDRQRALLDGYIAEAEGDLVSTYQHYQVELVSDPYDVFVNTAGMIQAFLMVNRPAEAIALYNMIPVDSLDLDDCVYCQTRPRLATLAYLEQGMRDSAAVAAESIPMNSHKSILAKLLPAIVINDKSTIKAQLETAFSKGVINNVVQLHAQIAWQFILEGYAESAKEFCEEAIATAAGGDVVVFEANYILGNYDEAIAFMKREWLPKYSDNVYVLNYAARSYARAGKTKELAQVIDWVKAADKTDDYGYGQYTYMLGVIEAIKGNNEEALDLLQKGYYEGYGFSPTDYQNDIDLMSLFQTPRFESIIHPKVD